MSGIRNSSSNASPVHGSATLPILAGADGKPADLKSLKDLKDLKDFKDLKALKRGADHHDGDLRGVKLDEHAAAFRDAPLPGFAAKKLRVPDMRGGREMRGDDKGTAGPGGPRSGAQAERTPRPEPTHDPRGTAEDAAGKRNAQAERAAGFGDRHDASGNARDAVGKRDAGAGEGGERRMPSKDAAPPPAHKSARGEPSAARAPRDDVNAGARPSAGAGASAQERAAIQEAARAAPVAVMKASLAMPGAAKPVAAAAPGLAAAPHMAAAMSMAAASNLFAAQAPTANSEARASGAEDADGARTSSEEASVPDGKGSRRARGLVSGGQRPDDESNDAGHGSSGEGSGSGQGYAGAEGAAAGKRKKRAAMQKGGRSGSDGNGSIVDSLPPSSRDPLGEARQEVARIADDVFKLAFGGEAGTTGSFAALRDKAAELSEKLSSEGGADAIRAREQLARMVDFMEIMSQRKASPETPTQALSRADSEFVSDPRTPRDRRKIQAGPAGVPIPGMDASPFAAELQDAVASGDVFSIVYAIMKMMYLSASASVGRRAEEVKRKNAEQEQVREAQDKVRALLRQFDPGAKSDDTLNKITGKQARITELLAEANKALKDIGWDMSTFKGALSGGSAKQDLDNLVNAMDSKLTSYNSMNSLETQDLVREGQAGQTYLSGMGTNTNREYQTINNILRQQ